MSDHVPRLDNYLRHILQAIERIQAYTVDLDEASFLTNTVKQDAVIRNLEIIGEASGAILRKYPEMSATRSDIPFRAAYQMRNALMHGYFIVDLGAVWLTVQADLPPLAAQAQQLLGAPDQG
jgi:uncharacterized protein with HEPN domain